MPLLNVVLYQPEIPSNTGNIARTCLATGARLHLIKPLGFSIDDRQLKRAGLDYWDEVDVRIWENVDELFAATREEAERRFFFTTKTRRAYYEAKFKAGDWLFFGRETKGLPESLLEANAENCVTIPMESGARSLNLSVAAGIAIYEARRQFAAEAAG
ncbi:MAG: tRNA (cytidine(34)-2'-O)-methyltransferase [Chthoniobacteraceae bacterium]|jgi:tRNA (cytidine/uridine-2'-O-)-methyltransferase